MVYKTDEEVSLVVMSIIEGGKSGPRMSARLPALDLSCT